MRSWELGIRWLGGGFDKEQGWGGAVYGRYFPPGVRSAANYQKTAIQWDDVGVLGVRAASSVDLSMDGTQTTCNLRRPECLMFRCLAYTSSGNTGEGEKTYSYD